MLALTTAGSVASAQSAAAPAADTTSATTTAAPATSDSATTLAASDSATKPATSDSATNAAAPAADSLPNFFRDIQANAFVSFGYLSNLNRPQDQQIGLRYFDTQANTFSLDGVEVVLQKAVAKAGDAGFRVDLVAGSTLAKAQAAGLSLGTSADLQQAIVSYIAPVGNGLRLDVGKFVTHMGYELIEGYDGYNDNYSRSLLFNYAIPLTHTGIKASYSINSMVSVMGMVVNGWDNAIDNNASKSIGAQLAILPAPPLAFYVNYIGGPENADDNHSIRHVVDLIGTFKASDALSLGVNADYGREDGTSLVVAGEDAKWYGVAGYAKISTPSPFSVGLRAETFKDDGGTRLGLGRVRASEFTVTPALKFGSNFVVRGEGRFDWVDDEVFTDDEGMPKKTQGTLGINFIWVY
jgi:hypothetical protein